MTTVFGAQGVYPTPRGQPTQVFDLQPGLARIIPAGTWELQLDPYSTFQEYDPVSTEWISNGGEASTLKYVNSDGFNYRVINQQGCIVGANVTVAGSGYVAATPPTISFTGSASAAATAIIGGAVSTSVTVTNGGTNYTWPPLVFLDAPPQGAGFQATATCAITSAAVSSVTINNQGAGYTNVPNLYFINDPRDTTGSGASAVATLTGAGTVTQLNITNQGTPATTGLPTIAFSSGSAAATPIMVRSIGGIGLATSAGSGYTGNVLVQAYGNGLTGSANVLTNPKWTTNLVRTRVASMQVGVNAATALTSAGISLFDGGIYAGTGPTAFVFGAFLPFTGVTVDFIAVPTFTWANNTSTCALYPV